MLAAMASFAWGAEPSASASKGVAEAKKEWVAACLKPDKAALDKLLSPELTYTHSSAKTQTKDDFIQDVVGGGTKYKSIEFENSKMRQYGASVVVTNNATITSEQTGTSHLYITEVWAQEKGHWVMVSRQATKLP